MSLAWFLGARFRRGKQRNGYISFISFSSTAGIALGCFVLIVLLSIMNGFERELLTRILAVVPHGELYSISDEGIDDWQHAAKKLGEDPRISSVEPYTKITGMLQHKGKLRAIELTGLDLSYAKHDRWRDQVSKSDWVTFKNDENSVLLGAGFMTKLSLQPGDRISVLIPTATQDLSFKAPHTMSLTVAGALSIGGEMDNYVAMMHLDKASVEAGVRSGAQGLRFRLQDPYSAYETMRSIGYEFPQAVYISYWTRTQGHLYNDIQLVRTVVYIALTLVIAVACFNIVSSLVMAVREKRGAIAILKTMGASDRLIRQTFVIQGLINGVLGIVIGTVSGVLVAPNLSAIVTYIEKLTGVTLLSGDIYFIDFLPSELQWVDVAVTVSVALVLCLLATWYPASRAVNISPASALNG
ncbi:lipoprotein-releasing ABC transporter permease subunit LolE [Aestuariibacter sp. A3R04]|uniref:lipoprotein-releasing ABC transporter permease subunit LolE n=1 Tax=Aestuariibacter sp. A3R04 TaxID=2841571 RepID=UPI001C0837B3|nr:lipoprotein-releasing ABC transporter permease subunit LolE [Aestuariibacter sp. A3R04]MBU3022704.1 lipoprotein-releasing ABC transporter permease subunit LolE [Aestuariibacter sp. A3R04]